MTIGSIGIAQPQGYFNTSGSLLKYMTSLTEKKNTVSFSNDQYFNKSLFNDLGRVGAASNQLRTQISSMASLNQFSSSVGKVASYTDDKVLSAKVASNATVSSFTKTDVNVTQLAAAQQNKGADLTATDNSFGSKFELSITDAAGKTTSYSVNLGESDNNKSAMQMMADKINAAGADVKATLIEDKETGTVSLQLTGSKTGETQGKFTVNDSSAANTGNVSVESADAKYTVNGKDFSSNTNDVKIIDGVTATLNKTGATQISYERDMSSAVDSVQNFVDTFNSLRDAASGSKALNNQLLNVASNYSRALGYAGIGLDSKGNLQITDKNKLSQSISDGSFSKNFQGVNSFGNRLNDVSKNAYRAAYDAAVQESFKNLMDQQKTNGNNAVDSWWQSANSGLLFNMLI